MQKRVSDIVRRVGAEMGISPDHAELMFRAPWKHTVDTIRPNDELTEETTEDDRPYFIHKHLGTFRISEKRLQRLKSKFLKNGEK